MYYVPLASGYWRVFASPRGSFWCCTGTGVESFSKLADSIYFHDDSSLYVNLFISSALDWEEKGIHLQQESALRGRGDTSLRIRTAKPVQLAIRVREPYWTDGKMPPPLVNGRPVKAERANGYWVVDRSWENLDELRVTLPMKLHVQPMPDDPTLQAIMYGPLVLAGDLGREGLTEDMRRGGDNPPELKHPAEAPEFVAASPDPASWIESRAPLVFETRGQSRNVRLVPFHQILDQRYAVYWRVRAKSA